MHKFKYGKILEKCKYINNLSYLDVNKQLLLYLVDKHLIENSKFLCQIYENLAGHLLIVRCKLHKNGILFNSLFSSVHSPFVSKINPDIVLCMHIDLAAQ